MSTLWEGNFESLVSVIVQIHQGAQDYGTKAVNIGLSKNKAKPSALTHDQTELRSRNTKASFELLFNLHPS